ncbi:hypothetical protein LR48_Vigan07g109200 [Vigna angularis]|uniref:Uncharacterized protein n=1 Tax=Phaseolus angularis TaxID=3914 RepID=A0A0L9UX96_PHAAN|nr:hypothetical protein LR48_Vigan07g109200 [Vigna angularis]
MEGGLHRSPLGLGVEELPHGELYKLSSPRSWAKSSKPSTSSPSSSSFEGDMKPRAPAHRLRKCGSMKLGLVVPSLCLVTISINTTMVFVAEFMRVLIESFWSARRLECVQIRGEGFKTCKGGLQEVKGANLESVNFV